MQNPETASIRCSVEHLVFDEDQRIGANRTHKNEAGEWFRRFGIGDGLKAAGGGIIDEQTLTGCADPDASLAIFLQGHGDVRQLRQTGISERLVRLRFKPDQGIGFSQQVRISRKAGGLDIFYKVGRQTLDRPDRGSVVVIEAAVPAHQ